MTKRLFGVSLVLLLSLLIRPRAAATGHWDAAALFDGSVTHNLRFSKERGALELDTGELFEDDGPASGHSYKMPENRETLTSQTWIKKDLLIPNPQARAAYLVVLSEEPFEAMINEPQKQPGMFRVHLDTETPSFKTYLAEIDSGEKTSVASGFTWTLHPGTNSLRVRPENVAGREGIPSWITLEYAGQ